MASTLFREPGWTSPLSQHKPEKVVWTPKPNHKPKTKPKPVAKATVKSCGQTEEERLCECIRKFVTARLAEIDVQLSQFDDRSCDKARIVAQEKMALVRNNFAKLMAGGMMMIEEKPVRSFSEFSAKARKFIRRQKAMATSLHNLRHLSSGMSYFVAAGTAATWVKLLDHVIKARNVKPKS